MGATEGGAHAPGSGEPEEGHEIQGRALRTDPPGRSNLCGTYKKRWGIGKYSKKIKHILPRSGGKLGELEKFTRQKSLQMFSENVYEGGGERYKTVRGGACLSRIGTIFLLIKSLNKFWTTTGLN